VPFLGSIPIIGELFKTRSVDKVKTNLMIFIRPRVLRDGVDAAIETNAKYNYVRDQQLNRNKGKVSLMPGEHQPTLPALEQLVAPQYVNPTRPVEAAPAAPAASPPVARPEPTTPFGETPAAAPATEPAPPPQGGQP
jgi:general secretion pathway protein D